MAPPALPTSPAPGCEQPQTLVPDIQNPPVGIASRPLHPCCCPIWETVTVPSVLQCVPRPSCATTSVVGAGPDPLTAALCSPYLLGPLTHMWSEHAPAGDTVSLSQAASVPVALPLVMVGSVGLLQAGRGAPGRLWGSLPACAIPTLGRRGSGSGGLLHCMAVISPAQLQTHAGHSPTHLLLAVHTPSTLRWPGRAGTPFPLGPAVEGRSLGTPLPLPASSPPVPGWASLVWSAGSCWLL